MAESTKAWTSGGRESERSGLSRSGRRSSARRYQRGTSRGVAAASHVARERLLLGAAELARRAELELARHGLVRNPPEPYESHAALTTHDRADLTETSEAAAICTGAIHKASSAERAPSMPMRHRRDARRLRPAPAGSEGRSKILQLRHGPSPQQRPKYNNTSIDKPRGAAPPRAANKSPRRRERRAHRAAEKAACSASFCARHLSNALFVSAKQARNASNSAPLFALREAMRPSPQDLCGMNFGRPTPSTRRAFRNCICSMARRFYAIDATMYVPVTAAARWRGGSRGHEGPRNNSQDILTHWLIFAQHRT